MIKKKAVTENFIKCILLNTIYNLNCQSIHYTPAITLSYTNVHLVLYWYTQVCDKHIFSGEFLLVYELTVHFLPG